MSTEVVTFSPGKVDTHGTGSLYNVHSILFRFLELLKLKSMPREGYALYTTPLSGIYYISSTAPLYVNGAMLNCAIAGCISVTLLHLQAGDRVSGKICTIFKIDA